MSTIKEQMAALLGELAAAQTAKDDADTAASHAFKVQEDCKQRLSAAQLDIDKAMLQLREDPAYGTLLSAEDIDTNTLENR